MTTPIPIGSTINGDPSGTTIKSGFVDEPQEDEPVISAVSNEESRRPSRAGYEWQENALGGSTSQMNEIGEDTLAQLSRDLHKALLADGSWPRNMTARAHEARPNSATGPARGTSVAGRICSHASRKAQANTSDRQYFSLGLIAGKALRRRCTTDGSIFRRTS